MSRTAWLQIDGAQGPLDAARAIGALLADDLDGDGDVNIAIVRDDGWRSSTVLLAQPAECALHYFAAARSPDLEESETLDALLVPLGEDRPDIVTPGSVATRIAIVGRGDVLEPSSFASGRGALPGRTAAAADVNGDGALDLLVTLSLARPVIVMGGHDARIVEPVALLRHDRFWLVDLDGDGVIDALGASAFTPDPMLGTVHFVRGDRSGFTGSSPAIALPWLGTDGPVALADLDVNGDLDVVRVRYDDVSDPSTTKRRVMIAWNDGAGGFSSDTTTVRSVEAFRGLDPSAADLAAADLDLDGMLNLVVAELGGLVWLEGIGAPSFLRRGEHALDETLAPSRRARLALADLERDGNLDVLVARAVGPGPGTRTRSPC